MDADQFAYWLQGFAELNEAPPTEAQWKSIREHLATVFTKVTPRVEIAPVGPRSELALSRWLTNNVEHFRKSLRDGERLC